MTLHHAPIAVEPATDHHEEEAPITLPMPGRTGGSSGMRVRTHLRAGDCYLMVPPGSNDRNRTR